MPQTAEELCALLPLSAARRIVPALSGVQADREIGPACRYHTPDRGGFVVLPGHEPRGFYEDRQWAPADDPTLSTAALLVIGERLAG